MTVWRPGGRVLAKLPNPVRAVTEQLVQRARARRVLPVADWVAEVADPWSGLGAATAAVACNICRWAGDAFLRPGHCEATTCPRCGAIGRDRFLFWALQNTVARPASGRLRVLETSPRLGADYRAAMGGWFDYLCSDFDERAHSGMIRLDLQAIELPDECLDVILTPHVLEHVPDTDRALAELHRVLRPGGALLLQVPLLQGRTAAPVEPEFHGDDTPVMWRFGPELSDRLEAAGFRVRLLVTGELAAAAESELEPGAAPPWPQPTAPEWDVDGLLAALRGRPELSVVSGADQTERYGFAPGYMYATWAAVRR
ncbi:MAG: class I SAM-dependent methyltransferase [Acidimicrobiales bacterium]|nr:class I SAM-dependent methyltransferase [Acidimicrobiales bacterium]